MNDWFTVCCFKRDEFNLVNISLLINLPLLKNLKIKIHRTIILPVVVYGCETWSLTLREKRRLKVFENRVLRRIFGPEWDEVIREWRKLHNEEFNDLYCSPNIFPEEWDRRSMQHVWGEERCIQDFGGETWGEELLGRPRRRWEDNIKMDLQDVGCGGMDWIDLAQDKDRWRAIVNAVTKLWVP